MLNIFFYNSRYSDGSLRLRNPNIERMKQDILYHLALDSGSNDLQQMFGDVKVYLLKYLIIISGNSIVSLTIY